MKARKLISDWANKPYAIPLLLLLLAFAFKSPGLWPWGVALENDQLLVFPPWQANFPDVSARAAGGDPLLQQVPWRHWAQDEFSQGRFPLWASGPLGGAPLFAYYQTAVLYPLNLLLMLIPIKVGLGIILALKVWLAGLGMWVLVRSMGLKRSAAFLSAISLMFFSNFVVWLPWGHTNVFLLLPWLAWAVHEWCVKEKKGALVAFAVLVLFAILGGHPENLSFALITVVLLALGLIAGSEPTQWLRQIAGLGIAGVLGILMGAIQLLPFVEALGLSEIAADPNRGTAWRLHLGLDTTIGWVLPRFYGQFSDGVVGPINFTESGSYVGLPALLGLAFLIVASIRRQVNFKLVIPWFIVLVFSWLLIYDSIIGQQIRKVPPLDRSIGLRWLFVVGFSGVVLSAFGWDWFGRWVETRAAKPEADRQASGVLRRALTVVGIVLMTLGIFVMIEHLAGVFGKPIMQANDGGWSAPNDSYRWYWALWAIGVALAVAGATLLWSVRSLGSRTSLVMSLLLGGLATADLWMLTMTYFSFSTPDKYYPTTSFISQVQSLVPGTERIIMEGRLMPPDTGLVFNIRDWRYQDPMISERAFETTKILAPEYLKEGWMAYNSLFPTVRMEVAPALGIRYAIYPSNTNPATWEPFPDRPAFKRLAFKDGLGLYEIQDVPGFAYLSDHVDVAATEQDAARWLDGMTWSKIRSYPAVVEAPASAIAEVSGAAAGSSPGSVGVSEYTPGHIKLTVDAQRSALLVVSESYYPGWHATLDGQRVEILRTNYISQGIVVPAGQHSIEMKYEPDSFRNGALLSLAGVGGLAGLWVWARRKPKALALTAA